MKYSQIILITIFVSILTCAFIGQVSSAKYNYEKMQEAIASGNITEIEKYIDIDKTVEQIIINGDNPSYITDREFVAMVKATIVNKLISGTSIFEDEFDGKWCKKNTCRIPNEKGGNFIFSKVGFNNWRVVNYAAPQN